jgi:hypothetical protein
MSREKEPERTAFTLMNALIFNFMRLCALEGVETENAYRELELGLEALDELKPTRT